MQQELKSLPDPMVGEVVDFVRHLKARGDIDKTNFLEVLKETYGSVPDLSRPPQGEMPAPKKLA